MAMYLGSFANGLFSGAQSAFQLYSMYQGIKSQQEGIEALDKRDQIRADEKEMDSVNKESPGWNKTTHTPGVRRLDVQPGTPDQAAAPVKAPSEGPGVNTERVANTGFGGAIGGRKALDKKPGTGAQAETYPPQPNETGPMYPFEQQMPNPAADYGPAIPTPQPPPPVTSPPAGPSRTPGLGGVPLAALQFMPQAGPPAPPAPAGRTDATAPVGGYFGPNGPYPQQRPPIRQPGGPYQPPPQQMPARPPPPHEPYGPETPPGSDSVAAPPVTQGVGGYLGPNGPYPQQPPPQQPSGGPVILPQDPLRYTPPVVPQQQPGGGAGGTGGTPLAQAEPSVGGRILGVVGNALSAINPIGSAHAANMSPEQQYGGVGAPSAGPSVFEQGYNAIQSPVQNASPMSPRQMYGGEQPAVQGPPPPPTGLPAAPAAAPAAPAATAGPYQPYSGVTPVPEPTGITPANPPTSGPAPQTPAPVAVPGQAGQVAPAQRGPSQQSEPTPPVIAPPVSPHYWDHFAKNDPKLASLIEQVIAEQGSGISKYDVAAIIYRESRGRPGAEAHGAMGAGRGLMQIEPSTQKLIDPEMRLDPFNPKDNITLGVKLMQDLGVRMGLGLGSVQMHVAYMRGFGAEHGLARLQQVGWEQYSKEQKIAADGVNMLYDGKVPIHNGMFPGGGGRMTAEGVVQAFASGPDGGLSYMAESGPPGMGMSDRWRQVQSLLEHSAIRSGRGVEALGPIQDWVAQQAHQGAVSNLLAAYTAMSSGNGVGAASALAKAHAFFPDDTYGRFGVDKKGQVWAEQFSETTGESMGKPFQITQEMLGQQVLALQHPNNFVEVLQKYQNGNADIVLKRAQAKYYEARPDIEREKQATALEIAGLKGDVEREKIAGRAAAVAAAAEGKAINTAAIDTAINTQYDPTNKPATDTDDVWAAQGDVDRRLRMPTAYGGAGLSGPMATNYAKALTHGTMELAEVKHPQTGQSAHVIRDANGGKARTQVSPEQAAQLRLIPGIKLAGTTPIPPPAAAGQQRATGPVGAGLGSQAALSSGYNTYTGLPTKPMPQQQATV